MNSESEIKLKEEKEDLMNIVTDIYRVHTNIIYNEKEAAEYSSAEKLI